MSSVLYADNSAKDENGSYAELAWKWVMQLYNVHLHCTTNESSSKFEPPGENEIG